MPERYDAAALEHLKTDNLDGKLGRDAFLEASQRLGAAGIGYDWLNEPKPNGPLAPGVTPVMGADELRSLLDERRTGNDAELAFRPKPEQFAWTFGSCAAIRSVKPGQLVRLWTEDALGGRVRATSDLPSKLLSAAAARDLP